jgi:mitochondrial fission protein ELM1
LEGTAVVAFKDSNALHSRAVSSAWTREPIPACWCLTDGGAGMVSQVRGLAQAIGVPYEIKTCRLKPVVRKLWPGAIPAWTSALVDGPEYASAAPRLAISCGRQSVVGSRVLKRIGRDRILTIHTQDPKVALSAFDLIVAPEHDGLTGHNVLATRGAVHHVTSDVLRAAREQGPDPAWRWDRLHHPIVPVLIGGTNRHYEFGLQSLSPMIAMLLEAARVEELSLVILPSRRTPRAVTDALASEFSRDHFVWDGSSANPYMFALASASHIIVTGDSVSMISEATATGRPVHVYHLPERRHARRFRRFHTAFEQYGYTRRFTGRLRDWSYIPPNETARVSEIIRERLEVLDVPRTRPQAA